MFDLMRTKSLANRFLCSTALAAAIGLAAGLTAAPRGASAEPIFVLPSITNAGTIGRAGVLANDPANFLPYGDFLIYSLPNLAQINGVTNTHNTTYDRDPDVGTDVIIYTNTSKDNFAGIDDSFGANQDTGTIAGSPGNEDKFIMDVVTPANATISGDPDGGPANEVDGLWSASVPAIRNQLNTVDVGTDNEPAFALSFSFSEDSSSSGLTDGDLLIWIQADLFDDSVSTVVPGATFQLGPPLAAGNAQPYTSDAALLAINSAADPAAAAGSDGWAYVHRFICNGTSDQGNNFLHLGECGTGGAAEAAIETDWLTGAGLTNPALETVTQNRGEGGSEGGFIAFNKDLSDAIMDPLSDYDRVEITAQIGWLTDGPDDGWIDLGIAFQSEVQPPEGDFSITGTKYDDTCSPNGSLDGCEVPVQGWLIKLLDDQNQEIETTVTDPDGQYLFDGLAEGTYTVMEDTSLAGWMPTGSTSGLVAVNADACSESLCTGPDFFNKQLPELPEPGSLAVFGFGLAGLGFLRRRAAAAKQA